MGSEQNKEAGQVGEKLNKEAEASQRVKKEAEIISRRDAKVVKKLAQKEATETEKTKKEAEATKKAEQEAEEAKREANVKAKEQAKKERDLAKIEAKEAKEREKRESRESEKARKEAEKKAGQKPEVKKEVTKEVEERTKVAGDLNKSLVKLLVAPPVDYDRLREAQEQISNSRKLSLLMVSGSVDEGTSIYLSLKEPLSLAEVLKSMPAIAEVFKENNQYWVRLRAD